MYRLKTMISYRIHTKILTLCWQSCSVLGAIMNEYMASSLWFDNAHKSSWSSLWFNPHHFDLIDLLKSVASDFGRSTLSLGTSAGTLQQHTVTLPWCLCVSLSGDLYSSGARKLGCTCERMMAEHTHQAGLSATDQVPLLGNLLADSGSDPGL